MKRIVKNILLGSFALLASGFFYSCNGDDELNSQEMKIYMRMPNGTSTGGTINIAHKQTGSDIISTEIKFPVQASRALPADVVANFEVDESLIEAYNVAQGKQYQPLPAAAYSLKNGGKLTIKAGSMISADSMQIEFKNTSACEDGRGYLVPISMKKIESADKGAEISSNFNTIYIVVTVSGDNVKPQTAATLAGTVVTAGTGWSLKSTTNNGLSYTDRAMMIDGIYNNGGAYITTVNVNYFYMLDLGSSQTIKGIKMYTFNQSATICYTPNGFEISTSDTEAGTATPWYNIGSCTNAIKGTYVTPIPNGEVPFFIEFYTPVTTRYLKIRHTGSYYSTYWGIREIEIVK